MDFVKKIETLKHSIDRYDHYYDSIVPPKVWTLNHKS